MSLEELLKPAVDGTLSVLEAGHEMGVKRVVLTASVATISDAEGKKTLYSHEDTVDPEESKNEYTKSKILAENAAWEYVESLKSGETPLELNTIHPAGIVGPTFNKDTEFTSMIFLKSIAEGKMPLLPKITMGFTDVRELAEAHEKALYSDPYNRYVVVGESLFMWEVAELLGEEFKDQGINPSTRQMPWIIGKIGSWFNPFLNTSIGRWGMKIEFDSSLAMEHLDYNPRPAKETLIDMCNSLIEQGYIMTNP